MSARYPGPFAVVTSAASVEVDGPTLVRDSMTVETFGEALEVASRIGRANRGLMVDIARRTTDGWAVRGTPIRAWVRRFGE